MGLSYADRRRLEEAHEPEVLTQETIIHNMSPEEMQRLSRVRNIGIAVGDVLCSQSGLAADKRSGTY